MVVQGLPPVLEKAQQGRLTSKTLTNGCQIGMENIVKKTQVAGFLSKKIFWFLICKKKIKWLKRGTTKYYGLKNSEKKKEKKKILNPYDGNYSILFDISKCLWLISTYILSETRNYVYIIFCANTIISSATRHHSNIFLASTNNI